MNDIIGSVAKRLDKFLPDGLGDKKKNEWIKIAKTINHVENLNIRFLSITFIYLYRKFGDIKSFPSNEEKIKFIQQVLSSPIDQAIVKEIVDMVVAEGGNEKINFKSWYTNPEIQAKFNVFIGAYSVIILKSL